MEMKTETMEDLKQSEVLIIFRLITLLFRAEVTFNIAQFFRVSIYFCLAISKLDELNLKIFGSNFQNKLSH